MFENSYINVTVEVSLFELCKVPRRQPLRVSHDHLDFYKENRQRCAGR